MSNTLLHFRAMPRMRKYSNAYNHISIANETGIHYDKTTNEGLEQRMISKLKCATAM